MSMSVAFADGSSDRSLTENDGLRMPGTEAMKLEHCGGQECPPRGRTRQSGKKICAVDMKTETVAAVAAELLFSGPISFSAYILTAWEPLFPLKLEWPLIVRVAGSVLLVLHLAPYSANTEHIPSKTQSWTVLHIPMLTAESR